jgi:hypothetical protein
MVVSHFQETRVIYPLGRTGMFLSEHSVIRANPGITETFFHPQGALNSFTITQNNTALLF